MSTSSGDSNATQTSPNKRQSDDNPEESNKKQKLNNGLTVVINNNANPTSPQGDRKTPIPRPVTPIPNAKNNGKPLKDVTELDTEIATKYDKIWKDVKTYVAEKYLMVEKLSKSNKGEALTLNIKDEKSLNEGSNTNSNNASRSPSPSKLKTSADRNTSSTSSGNNKSNTNETKKVADEKKTSVFDNKFGAGAQVKQDPVHDEVSRDSITVKTEKVEQNTNISNNIATTKEEKKGEIGSIIALPSSPIKLESIGDGTDSDDTIMLVADSIPVNKQKSSKGDESKADQVEKMDLH
jgi:hypothetical protein